MIKKQVVPVLALALLMLVSGCGEKMKPAPTEHVDPAVKLVRPEQRTIVRHIGQPAFINAFERTSMYPKVAGFIIKWNVDIGDLIKKDQVLCELYVPELEAEVEQKKAEVVHDKAVVEVARQMVSVARTKIEAAQADVVKAQADVGGYQALVERWQSEVKRLTRMANEKVVDRQILDESERQLKANIAQRDAAEAAIKSAEAEVESRKADLSKAHADVDAADASTKVADANLNRVKALYSYTKLVAPYDGIVIVRNANKGDFVQPADGDHSSGSASPGGPEARNAPIYVVARTDIVRVYVDVPEMDANSIVRGMPGQVRVVALDDTELTGSVTRTSWALDSQTRTLRAEIDLPNPDAMMLPGMYAYGEITVTHKDVMALPLGAIVDQGDQKLVYLHVDGMAEKTPVQVGGNDGKYVAVNKKQSHGKWVPFDGHEEVIMGTMSEISDGEKVRVRPDKARMKSESPSNSSDTGGDDEKSESDKSGGDKSGDGDK